MLVRSIVVVWSLVLVGTGCGVEADGGDVLDDDKADSPGWEPYPELKPGAANALEVVISHDGVDSGMPYTYAQQTIRFRGAAGMQPTFAIERIAAEAPGPHELAIRVDDVPRTWSATGGTELTTELPSTGWFLVVVSGNARDKLRVTAKVPCRSEALCSSVGLACSAVGQTAPQCLPPQAS